MKKLLIIAISLFSLVNLMGQNSGNIDSIVIIRHQVFEDTLQKSQFFYKGANKYHKLTREKVIRNRLLFKKGDSLDLELLYETEVRLRKFDFLSEAKTSVDTLNNKIIITVETKDNWSLIPTWDFESSEGFDSYGIGLVEYNFLGLGKTLSTGYIWESDIGGTIGLGYEDPQLYGSQWKMNVYGEYGPHSNLFTSDIYRPFYSSDIRWSYGLDVEIGQSIDRLFDGGIEISRMLTDFNSTSTYVSRRFGERYKKWRVSLSYEHSEDKYTPIEDATNIPLPEDELINAVTIGLKKKNIHFTNDIRLDKFVVTEDRLLGTEISGYLTKTAFPINYGVDRFEYGLSLGGQWQPFNRSYLGLSINFDSKETIDEIYSAYVDFYSRITNSQTLAFYTQITFSDNLRAYRQFLLGGDNGLRGYPARYIGGDYLLASTLEDRIFTGIQFIGVELGGVVFVDAGYVWKKDQDVSLDDILMSVGFGLRFGLFAYPGAEVMRVDYGIPINGLPPNFSLGFGQSF